MTREETRNYYTTTCNHENHSTFGGYIYNYDFDGYNSLSSIADRIISDLNFDYMCKQNAINRDRNKNYKKEVN